MTSVYSFAVARERTPPCTETGVPPFESAVEGEMVSGGRAVTRARARTPRGMAYVS